MKRAVGYLRVSTSGQADEGLSLEAQASKIQAWCVREEFYLGAMHEDRGLSGRSDDRPGLQNALADCRKGDVLIVYSLSRLARSTRDTLNILANLEARGVDLVSLSERLDGSSASGRMMVKLLAVLAEFESEQLGERTSMAMRHLKRMGCYTGGRPPFGFKLEADHVLIPNPDEQAIRARARSMRADGHSLRQISIRLQAEGLLNRAGVPFKPTEILRMTRPDPTHDAEA